MHLLYWYIHMVGMIDREILICIVIPTSLCKLYFTTLKHGYSYYSMFILNRSAGPIDADSIVV